VGASANQLAQSSLRRPRHRFPLPRFGHIFLLITASAVAIAGSFISIHWPYRHREILPLLEDVFGYDVKIEKYHRIYFPHPGFVATGITLRSKENPNETPLGTIQTLSVIGRWRDLLTLQRRVRLVDITRFHLLLPAPGNHSAPPATPHGRTDGFKGPTTPVDEILIHNSTLDILRANGGHYLFAIRNLQVSGVQRNHVMNYIVDMENPLPAGHISARGTFGPLRPDDLGSTAVSGQFTFNQVKLSDIGELRGTLASSGDFHGPLRSIQAEAITETPDFAVNDGHPTPIHGFVRCTVNGLDGDVFLAEVRGSSGSTVVVAHGQVAGSPKITQLEFSADNGRAEDVLRPFFHKPVPILGPITLHGSAFIAAPGEPFLQRLNFNGQFDVPAEKLTDPDKENNLSAFSRRMEDHKSGHDQPGPPTNATPDILAGVQGPVSIRKGIVSSSDLLFRVPGAHATLGGTFSLNNEAVHLTGTLKMDAAISHAVSGWKSVLLEPLQPFFRRKAKPGSEIPIAVTGGPGNYKVTQDITHKK
jgi:hypothetical protein